MKYRHVLAAIATVAATAAFTPSAVACGGGWWPDPSIDYRPAGLDRAEKDLDAGRYDDAAGSVLRMIPHIGNYQSTSSDPIVNRARRVLALAIARKGGTLDVERQVPAEIAAKWTGKGDQRTARLEWSVSTLRGLTAGKKAAPTAKAELAEAMAAVPKYRAEGARLLEKLAKKDLLPTAEGYAALARLRSEKGDSQGQLAALERCRAMTKNQVRLCGGHSAS